MTAQAPHFKIRLPHELKDRLEESAKGASRSLTAEIVRRLQDSFEAPDVVMLANRFAELRLVQREIEAQADSKASEGRANAALKALRFMEARIVADIEDLTRLIGEGAQPPATTTTAKSAKKTKARAK